LKTPGSTGVFRFLPTSRKRSIKSCGYGVNNEYKSSQKCIRVLQKAKYRLNLRVKHEPSLLAFAVMEIIKNLTTQIDPQAVRKALRLDRRRDAQLVQRLIAEAKTLIEPRAAFKLCYIDEKQKDAVTVEGLHLQSKVLRKNLDAVERLFPYVVSIGPALEQASGRRKDPLEKYYLDVIGNIALESVRRQLHDHLCGKYALKKISFMSPGSLPDWPIEAQSQLFQLLPDVEAAIGVRLSKSLLMIPTKSVSGIYFQTEVSFFNCQLCQRGNCPGRKARYDENRARDYGIIE